MVHHTQIIVVVGMPRSGTSALAGILHYMGIDMGEGNFSLRADKNNPKGYFENSDFTTLSLKMLCEAGSNLNYWRGLPPYERVKIPCISLYNKIISKKLIKKYSEKSKVWGWKDPRISLFLDFWYENLKDYSVKYIVIFRHPISVVQSLIKREIQDKIFNTDFLEKFSIKDTKDPINIDYNIFDNSENIYNNIYKLVYEKHNDTLYKQNKLIYKLIINNSEIFLEMWKRCNIDILNFLKNIHLFQ